MVPNGGYINTLQNTYYQSSYTSYPSTVNVTDMYGKNCLSIDYEGNIKYSGTPSKAANEFVKAIGVTFDKTSKKSMLARAYIRANDRILKLAKKMTKEELIAKLEEEQNNRECTEIFNRLSESEEDI
jgi:hypothetical protein